jgi:phage gp29-like protein
VPNEELKEAAQSQKELIEGASKINTAERFKQLIERVEKGDIKAQYELRKKYY